MNKVKLYKSLIAVAAASAMIVSAAFAANLFGIREILSETRNPLPDGAAADIQQNAVKGSAEGWSCRVTETLADGATVMAAVTVTADEKYLLAPTNTMPEDLAESIGVNGSGTVAEYAQKNGKELLIIGGGLSSDSADFYHESISYKFVSDNELVMLITAQKLDYVKSAEAVCTVTAGRPGSSSVDKAEMPISLKEAAAANTAYHTAAQTVSGIEFTEARVTKTSLGLNIQVPVRVTDEKAFYDVLKLEFDGVEYSEGGFVMNDDGSWTANYPMCRGSIGNELKIKVYNSDKEVIGTVALKK